jgi:hypothetical protein
MNYRDPAQWIKHTDAQHEARVSGYSAGWDHANFVEAYGPTADTEVPVYYEAYADIWQEAYNDGIEDFETEEADDEAIAMCGPELCRESGGCGCEYLPWPDEDEIAEGRLRASDYTAWANL